MLQLWKPEHAYPTPLNSRIKNENKHDKVKIMYFFCRIQKSALPLDSSYSVEPPTVNQTSKDIYQMYVKRGIAGAGSPTKHDLSIYQQYLSNKYL